MKDGRWKLGAKDRSEIRLNGDLDDDEESFGYGSLPRWLLPWWSTSKLAAAILQRMAL